jgi:cytochrome P450
MAVGYLIPGIRHILDRLQIPITKPKEARFFMNLVKQTIKMRMESNVRHNDILDLMIEAMKQELVDDDKQAALVSAQKHKVLDESVLVATAILMLVAGYDSTGLTMAYAFFFNLMVLFMYT